MDLKEQAKEIIKKGKALNDVELINIGLDMLNSYQDNSNVEENQDVAVKEVKTKRISKRKTKVPTDKIIAGPLRGDITDQFRVDNKSPIDSKYGKIIPLNRKNIKNKFVDDKTDALEDIGKTPKVQPKQRRKPVSKVNVTCTSCGKKYKILKELLYTESYRCDSCIMKGRV